MILIGYRQIRLMSMSFIFDRPKLSEFHIPYAYQVKFSFFEKVTKIEQSSLWSHWIFTNGKHPNHEEHCANFCGLLKKAEHYLIPLPLQ